MPGSRERGVLAALVAVLAVVETPARSDDVVPCWKVRAFVEWAGSEAEAVRLARKYGFSAAQIEDLRRRCR